MKVDRTRLVFPIIAAVLLVLLLHLSPARSQVARIFVDGFFSDWHNLKPLYTDASEDQASGGVDFGGLWGANDERFLFLRIDVGAEINMQNDNDIMIFLDTDDNSATGTHIHGIGAELEWDFGSKTGLFVVGTDSISIRHRHIGLVTAPTVTSTQFEIAFDRRVQPDGQTSLFSHDTIRIVFADPGAGGDQLPDDGNGVTPSR